MSQTLLTNEPLVRAACFLGILAAMALWEIAVSQSAKRDAKRGRTGINN